jgi:serine protease Do
MGVAVVSLSAVAAGYFGGRPLLEHVEFARAEADVQANRQDLNTMEDLSTVFRHVGKVVEPSVVNITVHKTVKTEASPDEDMIRKFFEQHGGQLPDGAAPDNAPQEEEQVGTGSGVIMDAADGFGYILTNNHVAGGATEMDVTLADGRVIHNAKVLGTDVKSDLAVVQIKADRLIPAKWGNSDELEKGDWVMAFGSPFGYIGSMTHGIVSALDRHDVMDQTNSYEDFIQVDAPINPGNSGGPLVNIHGEVVGINTAIATRSGGFQGIGFAIPSNQAKTVYGDLKTEGKVVRGWLGVSIGDVAKNADIAKSFGYTGDNGVLVEETFPNTPAYEKLQNRDIITSFNGKAVDNVQQLRDMVANTKPDTKVTLSVFRDGKSQDIDLTIGNQPDDIAAATGHGPDAGQQPAPEAAAPKTVAGMTLATLDKATAAKLGLDAKTTGAVITDVAKGSVAAKKGLQPGDVITMVGNDHVRTANAAVAALTKADLDKGIVLYVASPEGSRFVFLQNETAGN